MQERYDVQAAEVSRSAVQCNMFLIKCSLNEQQAAEREAAREEERRKQKLEDLENLVSGKGYRNKVKVERSEFGEGVDRNASGSGNNKSSSSKRQFRPGIRSSTIKLCRKYAPVLF